MCFRLREKKTDSWNLSQKNWNALFAYVYSVKYPIFMHYVTITSSSMYSVDICAVSQLLMMRQNNKTDCWNHSLAYLHSKVDYMCSVAIKYVLLNSISIYCFMCISLSVEYVCLSHCQNITDWYFFSYYSMRWKTFRRNVQ